MIAGCIARATLHEDAGRLSEQRYRPVMREAELDLTNAPAVTVQLISEVRVMTFGTPRMLRSWSVTTCALRPETAAETLMTAGPLLAAMMDELPGSGPVTLRLRDGKLLSPCRHQDALAVHDLTDHRVAWLCPECDRQLPADFSPEHAQGITTDLRRLP